MSLQHDDCSNFDDAEFYFTNNHGLKLFKSSFWSDEICWVDQSHDNCAAKSAS